jgi:signal transduction histidine kinase
VTDASDLDRLKEEFVAAVSHELRTPLTAMIGFLEMLRAGEAGELNAEQERYLGIVHRSAERLRRLVGDLLFVSDLDESGLRLRLEEGVRLDEIAGEAVESARPLALVRELDLLLAATGEVRVTGDHERLGELIAHLISNALKFTPAGGAVSVRVVAEADAASLEVEDTGIGIPLGEQERLFSRFFRTSAATEQAIPGTGLGLAIAKAIVDAHGGTVSVTSSPGMGTRVRVELPLGRAEPTPGGP